MAHHRLSVALMRRSPGPAVVLISLCVLTFVSCGVGGGASGAARATAAVTHTPSIAATLQRISAGAAAGAGENGPISATANCPSGTTLLSGGYELSGGTDADIAQILDNRPATASSWTAAAGSVVGGPFTLTVYANCLQAPFAVTTQIISAPVDVPVDGQYHDASAACPGDAQLSGGGFTSAEGVASGPQVNASQPLIGVGTSPHARAWDIQILRTQDPTPSTVYAICVVSPQMSEASVTARQTVSPTSGPLTVQCASGQLLIGGGFALDTDGANVSGSALATTGTQWTITASPFPFTGAPPSVNETAYAVCGQFSGTSS